LKLIRTNNSTGNMNKFKNIEFSSPDGDILIKQDGHIREFSENDTELINYIFERIRKDYTKAFDLLSTIYNSSSRNFTFFRYLVVRRFIRCNWANYDTVMNDIDNAGNFNFEQIPCPMRGECEGYNCICCPQFNSSLSDRELQILKRYGLELKNMEMIGKELFISTDTVDKHLSNIRRKLNIHDKPGLVKFCETHRTLFNNIL